MGSLYHRGSAYFANLCRVGIGASGVIQLGMAFGIDPENQRYGDILVSSRIFPYDVRDVNCVESIDEYTLEITQSEVTSYADTPYGRPKESLLRKLVRGASRLQGLYRVHIGTLLSGQARIRARSFRDGLRDAVLNSGNLPANHPIVGGEMEGVGLLSAATPENRFWIIVKGICDFADEYRDSVIEHTRCIACRNAAAFVLESLQIVK
jgi:nucleoside phosphorylase